jgi:hypothetical protein
MLADIRAGFGACGLLPGIPAQGQLVDPTHARLTDRFIDTVADTQCHSAFRTIGSPWRAFSSI